MTMAEDDAPEIRKQPVPQVALDRLGVAELDAYITGLRQEIVRAEAEIGRKRGLRSAADTLFRMP